MHRAWQIINNENQRGLAAISLRGLARGASWAYGLGAGLNQWGYDLGFREVIKVGAPVIGVGNITVGGSGKTPLTMAIAQTLLDMGRQVAVISRGYGRKSGDEMLWVSEGNGPLISARQSGDEPYLMASKLPVAVLVGADRVKLARAAVAKMDKVVIIGDDLFQHRRLFRDLDIVALDARKPLGNGLLLPAGPLREPKSALRRAGAIVLTRADDGLAAQQARIWLNSFWGQGPVLASRHQPDGVYDIKGRLPDNVAGAEVLAFCGLARPEAFAQSLAQQGLRVVDMAIFADHHWYTDADLAGLERRAGQAGARAIITTEKDMARLPPARAWKTPLWVSGLRLEITEGSLPALLENVVKR